MHLTETSLISETTLVAWELATAWLISLLGSLVCRFCCGPSSFRDTAFFALCVWGESASACTQEWNKDTRDSISKYYRDACILNKRMYLGFAPDPNNAAISLGSSECSLMGDCIAISNKSTLEESCQTKKIVKKSGMNNKCMVIPSSSDCRK